MYSVCVCTQLNHQPAVASREYSTCDKYYDQSRLPPGAATALTLTKSSMSPTSGIPPSGHQVVSPGLPPISRGSWWDTLDLPGAWNDMQM